MTIKKTLLAAGLAALTLATSAAGAFAASAVANSTVNVRSGPGTSYNVVDSLRRGDRVDVSNCRGSWCYVENRGTNGWVASSYLSSGRGYDDYDDRPIRRPPPPPPPRYYDNYGDGYYYGRPHRPSRPYWDGPRRPPRSSACFGGPGASVCFND